DDFVLLEKENSEIKSKKEKYQKRAREKRFVIFLSEIMIIDLIFMPLFFIFALFYSTIGSILISVPYFLMLGTIIVVFILFGAILTGRISIIKSKARKSIRNKSKN
ncbi:unnamed protein product, partial [marine sediment metagenome]